MPFEGTPPRIVLTLDLASTVGVAWGDPREALPQFSRWHLLRDQGEGARYGSFENELADLMEQVQPAHMIVEAALPLAAMARYSSEQVMNQQIALRGIARMWSWRGSASYAEIDCRTVRHEVAGLPWSMSRDTAKREVVRFCHRRGLKVPDDNVADACMIWFWHRLRVLKLSPCPGPLWSAAHAQ